MTNEYLAAEAAEGVAVSSTMLEWNGAERILRFGDFSDFCGGEPAAPIIYEPL